MFHQQRFARLTATVLVVVVGVALIAVPTTSQSSGLPGIQSEFQNSQREISSPSDLLFVENTGQWPEVARFKVWGSLAGVGTTWLTEDAIWISIVTRSPSEELERLTEVSARFQPTEVAPTGVALKLTFPGSNPDVRIEPLAPLTTTVSYFLGNDPAKWHPAVPVYGGVRYADLYPGVDLVMGGSEGAWQLQAAPGAAVDQVRVHVEGSNLIALDGVALQLDMNGKQLAIRLPSAPFDYHAEGVSPQGGRRAVTVQPGSYASQSARPADGLGDLVYSTFLGGGGGNTDIAVDGVGNAYVTGMIYEDYNFPTTPGAFDTTAESFEAFVAKLNPAGSGLVFATFLGGSAPDGSSAIAVDGAGSAYVTGETWSSDFPTTPGAFDPNFNGGPEAFAVKLNPAGSALVYGTFLGGSDMDTGGAIAVDGAGSAYVTGQTWSTNFPTTPGAFDRSHNGSGDSFVAKLNPAGSGLAYSTFLGGNAGDFGNAIALDDSGNAFVTGYTDSGNFPTTPGAFDTSYNRRGDAFAAKLNPMGSGLAYATFLGGYGGGAAGAGGDNGIGIAVDGMGSAYVTGLTLSSDFPTTPGAFDTSYDSSVCLCQDVFVVKLHPAGSALAYGTFLGGSRGDLGFDIAVDEAGGAYVTGWTQSEDLPTTTDAFDLSYNGVMDAFLATLNPAGSALDYATFLGGSGFDQGQALAVDGAGSAFVTGGSGSIDFPTTPGAFDPNNYGWSKYFVTELNTSDVIAPIEQPSAAAFVTGTVTLAGFAIELDGTAGTGVDRVTVYLDDPPGSGVLIGDATYGLDRPDVAAEYGERFGPSGWELAWNTTGLPPGPHLLYLYVHRTTYDTWLQRPAHIVVMPGGYTLWLPVMRRDH